MITEELLESINKGRQGKSQGYSIGLPKLEEIIDGVCKDCYYLIGAESGVGCNFLFLQNTFLIKKQPFRLRNRRNYYRAISGKLQKWTIPR